MEDEPIKKEKKKYRKRERSKCTSVLLLAAMSILNDIPDRDCPYCAERIKKKAILCKHCHSRIIPIL